MARYSGPALAAGAISKAIGDLFEGILAGQRGGLAAEKAVGEQGLAEREMALKGATFPLEARLARAQAGLAEAQVPKVVAETERIYQLTPEERAQLRAETGRTGAQADVYRWQASGMGTEQWLQNKAIQDWEQLKGAAAAKDRELTYEDTLSWARRHPVLLAGAQKVPAAALMDMSQLEQWISLLKSQQARSPYEGPKFMLDVQAQAHKEAGDIIKQAFGEQAGPEAADAQAWIAGASRNRILAETLGKDAQQHISSPGRAPSELVDYVSNRLRQEHPGESHETLRSWTYEILALLGMGAVSWQAAFENLRRMTTTGEGATPAVPVPAQGSPPAAPKGRSGGVVAPPGRSPVSAPGSGRYRYNPATGEMEPK